MIARDNAAAQVAIVTANCSPVEICQRAVAALDHVLSKAPVERLHEFDGAEIDRLVDGMMDDLRRLAINLRPVWQLL